MLNMVTVYEETWRSLREQPRAIDKKAESRLSARTISPTTGRGRVRHGQ
jgi:hypothetical protein